MSSAHDVPSVTPSGASDLPPQDATNWKLADPDGGGAISEPNFALEHDQLFNERALPLWNPYMGFGVPESAAMQQQSFNPLIAPIVAAPNPWTYSWYIVLRLFIAGFATYLFLRLFSGWFAAVISGIVFMLNGYFILYATMPHLSVEVLIPVLMLASERCLRRPTPWSIVFLAFATTLTVLGGMPESTVLALGFAFLFAFFRCCSAWRLAGRRRFTIAIVTLTLALGVGIASFVTVPFLEYERLSYNVHDPNVNGGTIAGAFGQAHPEWSLGTYLAPLMFGQHWAPTVTDYGDKNGTDGYWGFVAFFLATIAVVALLRSRLYDVAGTTIFFLSSSLFFVAKRFGFAPINWVGYLPILKYIIFPKYEEPLIAFSIAVLAGIGAGFLAKAERRDARVVTIASTLVVTVATSIYYVTRGLVSGEAAETFFGWSLLGGVAMLAASAGTCALLVRTIVPRRRTALASIIVVLLVTELGFDYLVPAYYFFDPDPPKSANPYAGAAYVDRLRSIVDDDTRISAQGTSFLFVNWAEAFRLLDVRYQDALLPERYLPFVHAFFGGDSNDFSGSDAGQTAETEEGRRFLRYAGVRYVIADFLASPDSAFGAMTATANASNGANGATATIDLEHWHDGLLVPGSTSDVSIERIVPSKNPHLRTCIARPLWLNDPNTNTITFEIWAREGAARRSLLFRRNSALASCALVDVSLERYAGHRVTLTFATNASPGQSTAFWDAPEIVSGGKSDAAFRLEFHASGVSIYRFRDALPRVRVVGAVQLKNGPDDVLSAVANVSGPDPARVAVLDRDDIPTSETGAIASLASKPPTSAGTATITSAGSSFVGISAIMLHPGFLVLDDTYFPGWRVRVDGIDAPIVRADYMFRGVRLEAGPHSVRFSYEPASFSIGVIVAVLCGFAVAVLAALVGRSAHGRSPKRHVL
jgi:hypothetical protein